MTSSWWCPSIIIWQPFSWARAIILQLGGHWGFCWVSLARGQWKSGGHQIAVDDRIILKWHCHQEFELELCKLKNGSFRLRLVSTCHCQCVSRNLLEHCLMSPYGSPVLLHLFSVCDRNVTVFYSCPLFRWHQNSKFFHSLSVTSIFNCLHGVLNVGKKNN
jgi:hypothetical protein